MFASGGALPAHPTCFFNDSLLFPLALGTGADKKWDEHAKTRSFITSFSMKNFGILRGAGLRQYYRGGCWKMSAPIWSA
jgi:hypothetical protein